MKNLLLVLSIASLAIFAFTGIRVNSTPRSGPNGSQASGRVKSSQSLPKDGVSEIARIQKHQKQMGANSFQRSQINSHQRSTNTNFSSIAEHISYLKTKNPTDMKSNILKNMYIQSELYEDQGRSYLVETVSNLSGNEIITQKVRFADEFIVRFKSAHSDLFYESFANDMNLQYKNPLQLDNAVKFSFDSRQISKIELLKEKVSLHESVSYVEYNDFVYLASVPNDPYLSQQWALLNQGLDGIQLATPLDGPLRGFDTGVTDFWRFNTDCRNTPIAIIDTGIDIYNPDLINQIDFAYAKDFSPSGASGVQDTHGHGTHVAGIIAAEGNNNLGISGVCWRASIIPIKSGEGATHTAESLGNALKYASQTPAKVINVSLLVEGSNSYIVDGIKAVVESGKLLVASAGNLRKDIDKVQALPAGFNSDYIVSVAASSADGSLADFSNTGLRNVDIAAPGDRILSLGLSDNGQYLSYTELSGTSQSAPYVTGSIALVWSYAPKLSALDIRELILNSARKRAEFDSIGSSRVLDLSNVNQWIGPQVSFVPELSSTMISSSGDIELKYQILNAETAIVDITIDSQDLNNQFLNDSQNQKIKLNLSNVVKARLKIVVRDREGFIGETDLIELSRDGNGLITYTEFPKRDRLRQVNCQLIRLNQFGKELINSVLVNDNIECKVRCQAMEVGYLDLGDDVLCEVEG